MHHASTVSLTLANLPTMGLNIEDMKMRKQTNVTRPANIDNGDDARGTANSRANQTRTQPESEPEIAAIPAEGAPLPAANIVPIGGGTRAKANIFNVAAQEVSERVATKMQHMGTIRQGFAEAFDLYKEGESKATEARAVSNKVALLLYQDRVAGIVSADEGSAVLGDIFGYKPKKDGTPGKTPDGQGEAIRKRVVRAEQAYQHLTGGDGGKFFEGLEADSADKDGNTLAEVVNGLETGEGSIWMAYETFAAIKREHMTRTNAAFDAKRIASIVEALSEEGAAETLANDPNLVAAYGALIDILSSVGEEAEAIRKAA